MTDPEQAKLETRTTLKRPVTGVHVPRKRAAAFSPQRLKIERRAAGITQAKLAAVAKLSVQSVSNYERGVATPSAAILKRMAKALRIAPNKLVDTANDVELNELRYGAGLGQDAVGTQLGLKPGSFSAVERGHRPPTPRQVELLATIYGHTPEYIMDAWRRTREILEEGPDTTS